MSALDRALQALLKLSIKTDIVWENAKFTNDFPAQTIQLTLSDVWGCLVGFKSSASAGAAEVYSFLRRTETGLGIWLANYNESKAVEMRSRKWTVNDSGITFSAGWGKTISSASYSTRNDYTVPFVIYTIKLLGGVIQKIKTFLASLSRREVQVCL